MCIRDSYITVPEGDVAREILGISSFHQDINSQHNPNNLDANQLPNRLMTVAANVVEPLQDFVDSVGIPLHYNPFHDLNTIITLMALARFLVIM